MVFPDEKRSYISVYKQVAMFLLTIGHNWEIFLFAMARLGRKNKCTQDVIDVCSFDMRHLNMAWMEGIRPRLPGIY